MAEIAPFDVTEGTAEYASGMMAAVVELGCDASDEALIAAVVAHLDEFASLDHYAGGREPYDLGVLAGLLLRQEQVANWETFAEFGSTPHEMLLEAATPVDQPDDPGRQMAAQAAVDARNLAAAEKIEPLLEHMASPDYHRVPLPFDWIAGSFSLGGFYYLADEPDQPDLMLDYTALHVTPSGTQVDVDHLTSLYGISHPCAVTPGSVVATVPSAALTDHGDGTYSSADASLSFANLVAAEVTDGAMLPWLCPEQMAAPVPQRRRLPRIGVVRSSSGRPLLVEW
jgi:hypothetical protein